MHDIHAIRQNPVAFDQSLGRRDLNDDERRRFSSEQVISIDERRRAIIRVREEALARRNALSKEIGVAKAKNDQATFERLMAQVEDNKASIARMEDEQKQAEDELNNLLAQIPNLPLDDVPDGKDASDNVEHHRFGAKRDYAFTPKQHFELGEALGQIVMMRWANCRKSNWGRRRMARAITRAHLLKAWIIPITFVAGCYPLISRI